MRSMSVIALISILSCVCFLKTASDERVIVVIKSEPETEEIIGHSKRSGREVDGDNFLRTGTETEDNHENTEVELVNAADVIKPVINSSTSSFQTRIGSTLDDTSGSSSVDVFANVSITEDGSLVVELLNQTSHVEASAQDKLRKDEADQDHKLDMSSFENSSVATVSLLNHSEPEMGKFGSAARKDIEFDENNILSARNEEETPKEIGVELDDTTEDTRSVINSSTRSFKQRLVFTTDKDDISGTFSVDEFADVSTTENGSIVEEPLSHTPRVEASSQDKLRKDEADHDLKLDMSSLENSSVGTISLLNRSEPEIDKLEFAKIDDLEDDENNLLITRNEEENPENTGVGLDDTTEGIRSAVNSSTRSLQTQILSNSNKDDITDTVTMNYEDYTRSGEVTTTTVDPIAALLDEVVIVDVNEYLPQGYVLKPEKAVEKEFVEGEKNINELLSSEDDKNDIKFKSGKLYGKKLAAIAKEMRETHLHSSNVDKIAQQNNKVDMETTESIRGGRILSDGIEFSAEQDSFTVAPITTANPTTTSTPRPTTPSVCGVFCNLAGTLFIRSGLEWSEELSYSFTEEFKEVTKHIVREVSRIFDHVYFGNSFEFATVEAYSRRDGMVLVDIYVQFNDIVFQITTKDVKEAFVDRLVQDDNKNMMGVYELDTTWTYFSVIDTTVPEASMTGTNDVMGIFLPEWSLLAIVVGVISLFVIGFLGVIVCVNRHRNNQLLKKHVLNPRTLQLFKSKRHFDTVEVDDATAYANDKRDMWTLQKANQHKRSRNSLSSRPSYVDSGRGSGSGIYSLIPAHIRESFGKSGRKLYEKFPHNRIRSSSVRNHNDSGAGLLEGFDNTRLNSSGVIPENIVDTSFGEDEFGGGVPSQRSRKSVAAYQWNNVHTRGEQGMYFNDSDSSDAVSDGPSEKL